MYPGAEDFFKEKRPVHLGIRLHRPAPCIPMDVSPVAGESKNTTCWANLSQVNLNDEDSVRHILHNSMEPPMKFQYGEYPQLGDAGT
jgi:hypothetical protein